MLTKSQNCHHLDEAAQTLMDQGMATGMAVAASMGGSSAAICKGFDRPGDKEGAWPLEPQTLFNVGSVTKCITGTLIADAITSGLIDPDRSVPAYLPRYQDTTDTIRQLATHTAGYAFNQMESWPETADAIEEFRNRVYRAREKRLKPIEEMAYWTTGYFILMEVLEAVHGTTIEEIAQERIFKPLQMNRTTFSSQKAQELGLVVPYDAKNDLRLEALSNAPPLGETGLWTTASDLIAFGQAILNTTFLPAETLHLMQKDQSQQGHLKTMGFWLRPPGPDYAPFAPEMSDQSIGHPGYTGCFLGIDPVNDFCVAVVSPSTQMQSNFANYGRIASAAWQDLSA